MTDCPTDSPLPRWLAVWVALLPPLYFLSPVALLGLRFLPRLPRAVWWLLGSYVLTQQLPALFAPEPLLASVLAAGRSALVLGLIGLGSLLQVRHLSLMAGGLLIVCVSAVVFTLVQGTDFVTGRLVHPYMTSVTVGLVAAWGLWLAALGQGQWFWRLPLAGLSAAVLLLSSSRGPLLAALIGLGVGLIFRQRQWWKGAFWVAVAGCALFGAYSSGLKQELAPLVRVLQFDPAGRQVIWTNALTVVQTEPLSGVGPYRLGKRLAAPGQCETFSSTDSLGSGCPEWLEQLGTPWLVAHNAPLQQLAESGPVGLLGLFGLLGAVTVVALRRREPLVLAALVGNLLININDNTLLVPGPFIGEAFWLLVGTQLRHLRAEDLGWQVGAAGAGLLTVLSIPILLLQLQPISAAPPQINFFSAASQVSTPTGYSVLAELSIPSGQYLFSLNSCTDSCRPISSVNMAVTDSRTVVHWDNLTINNVRRQDLELRTYPVGPGQLRASGVYRWPVTVESH